MTTLDKCPKCGSDTTRTTEWGRVFSCGSDLIHGIHHASPLCEMTQRAQRAEAELGKPTDDPNPSGSTHARLNWWKQRCDEHIERAEALLAATTRERQILYARLLECDHTPEEIEQILLEG